MSDDTNQGAGNGTQDSGGGSSDSGRAGGNDRLLADLADERKARQAAQTQTKQLEDKIAKLEEATKSDHEKALDRARTEAADEARKTALGEANRRIVRSEVQRLAAEKFADPSDPIAAMDLGKFEVDDAGNVDEKAIRSALDGVLKDKPHWAKSTERTTGSADQGARGSSAGGGPSMNDLIRQRAGR